MTDRIFDATALLETYRNALAPAFQAQQEGVKALERLARYQYAVAGDYLVSWLPSRLSSAPRSASSCAAAFRN